MEFEFKEGQEIVCIRESKFSSIKVNEVYTALKLVKPFCEHSGNLVDIGIRFNNIQWLRCPICGKKALSKILWHGVRLFAPLDDICNIDELQEVLESEIVDIC